MSEDCARCGQRLCRFCYAMRVIRDALSAPKPRLQEIEDVACVQHRATLESPQKMNGVRYAPQTSRRVD